MIHVQWCTAGDAYARRDTERMLVEHSQWCAERGFPEASDAASEIYPQAVALLRGCEPVEVEFSIVGYFGTLQGICDGDPLP